ncbi:hypothetical protein I203_101024 [Kwoniella mangroviensis CBS 8507]|uniref:uncharacterized protein n=1 Tax=Kwoniella mangroviensis CBS 8507 TaxID=1296122 RepID=UPI00080D542C|nr:uncharacterized protein I203_02662 [Kwoniella mangroviensis CBS 8507]OCF68003.1 hypothetical protein I203_02662 [Kwoniella mangroviensis CBS 8507]
MPDSTTRSTRMDNVHLPPHPDRPFSPSPPRENRHSASRPPSLLFGAPPVGTVASSSNLNVEGLPSTPPRVKSIIPRSPSHNYVNNTPFFDRDSPARRRYGSESSPSTSQAGQGRPTSIQSSLQRRDSESSTTSSASPPLGATSILSAIASSTPPRAQGTPSKSPVIYQGHVRTSSDITNIRTPTLDGPGSPKSYQSGFSSSSSNYDDNTSFSKSLPRLHQPTVVRRTSGRGLAFLPPPAQALSHSTAIHHHPRSSPTGANHDGERTASVASLQHIQHHAHMLDLGRPIGRPTHKNSDDKLISMKGNDGRPANQPTSYSEIPLPPLSLEETYILNEVEEDSEIGQEEEEVDVDDPEPFHPLLTSDVSDADTLSSTTSGPHLVADLSIPAEEDITRSVDDPLPVATPDIAERVLHDSTTSSENGADNEPVTEMNTDKGLPTDENIPTLHEVVSSQFSQADLETPTSPPPQPDNQASKSIGADPPPPSVPYKVREGSQTYNTNSPSLPDRTRQISLYATMNHSANPLPQLTAYRVELALSWGDAQILQWIPGRKYIPDWNLKVVGGNLVIDVRSMIKTVVSHIPIFWRFASWL